MARLYALLLLLGHSLFAVVTLQSQTSSHPWPMFRGTAQHTGYAAVIGPQKASLEWRYNVGQVQGNPPNSIAIGAEGTVYIGGGGKIVALDSSGTARWSRSYTNVQGPAIGADGTIYFVSRNSVVALDAQGNQRWQFATDSSALFGPTVGPNGTIYQGSWDGYFYAINPNGTLKWRYRTDGRVSYPSSISAGGTIYLGGGDAHAGPDPNAYAFDTSGTLKWKYNTQQLRVGTPAVLSDGSVYLPAPPLLIALDSLGNLKWTIGQPPTPSVTGVITPAIGPDGTIYVGKENGTFYAIDPQTRQIKWSYPTGPDPSRTNFYGLPSWPIVDAQGTVYFGSVDHKVYAVDKNGSLKWSYETGGAITEAAPAVDDRGNLYISSEDGYLYKFTAPPAAPTLVFPSDNAQGVSTTPTLSWNPSAGATSYRLQVSTSSSFATTVFDDSTLPLPSKQVGPLANSAQYFWRVSVKNAGGSSSFSASRSFTTIIAAPTTPTLALPADSAAGVSTTPMLNWNASSGASTYRLQVSLVNTFDTTVFDDSTITSTSRQVGPPPLANNTKYFWRVNAKNAGGTSAFASPRSFTTQSTSVVEQINNAIPTEYSLSQNYPNPFNPTTTIRYAIPEQSLVRLEIYNLLGQRVATLVDENQNTAFYQTQWNAIGVPSGMYFYRLQAGPFVEAKKLLLLK